MTGTTPTSLDISSQTPDRQGSIIVVDHVSKVYRPRGHQTSLRHEAMTLLSHAFRRSVAPVDETFWALRNVSFSVKPGESVAIIGRNGSGKTTLLRIISGITMPTEGRVAVHGRFAALIGLGAGFNNELTGRENIMLNAAIQGVPPQQVAEYMDEIVEFAEIGSYIDVAVKRYSSGMVTRLAFSIASHIFPEIIIVDEALSVGDAAFQLKCVERIFQMKKEGRTLLFVSHAPGIVQDLCERAVWLHRGELRMDGQTEEVLAAYATMLKLHQPAVPGIAP